MEKIWNLEGEKWLPVQGFEKEYHISSMGRLKSLEKRHLMFRAGKWREHIFKEKLIKGGERPRGYRMTTLYCKADGRRVQVFIHQLVARHFVENPNPERFKILDHKNNVKNDNRAENLEWCDQTENARRAFEMGLYGKGEQAPNVVLTDAQVLEIRRRFSEGVSNIQLSREFGVCDSTVRNIVRGRTWAHLLPGWVEGMKRDWNWKTAKEAGVREGLRLGKYPITEMHGAALKQVPEVPCENGLPTLAAGEQSVDEQREDV